MKLLTSLILLLLCIGSYAAERRPFENIDANGLTKETQKTDGADNAMDFIWWIPVEFWQVTLAGNPAVTQQQIDEIIHTLGPYSIIAVVQADISNFGAFDFFDESEVDDGLSISYVPDGGAAIDLPTDELVDPDVTLLLNQLSPVLTAAMGDMGENFYFFPLSDIDENGERLVSPYESGVLRVSLTAREGLPRPPYEFELPLDSLHTPRLCRNGKPAHISWKYCPWDGEKLKDK